MPAPPPATSPRIGEIAVGSPEVRRALVFSLWDGIFANVMLALVETFGIAAAVFLKAPAIAIATLGSLPLLLSSFGQLLIPLLVDPASGRKRNVLHGTTMQSLFLFLVAGSGYLPESMRVWSFVILFALYGFSGNVIAGFWIAWMGDLVPHEVRGRHFAWRNRIFSITQLACATLAGILSRNYTTATVQWLLFALVFVVAGSCRLISSMLLYRQYEPPIAVQQPHRRSLAPLFKQNRQFFFYCIAAALVQGSVAIAGPFFNVWYIRDLHFDYLSLSVATAATVLGTIVALPFWGKIADTHGNRLVIIVSVFLIATVPLPYIMAREPWHIWLLNFYTGCCWGGYNLSNFNYLLVAAGRERTELNISFAVAITGIVNFIFSIAGGMLATRLPQIFHYQLHSLFVLSSLIRFLVFAVFIVRYPHFETKHGRASDLFFQIPGYRSGLGLLRNSFRAFKAK